MQKTAAHISEIAKVFGFFSSEKKALPMLAARIRAAGQGGPISKLFDVR